MADMKLILFEDEGYEDLLPLVYFRPVWELRCGIFTLEEKIKYLFPETAFFYIARDYISQYYLSPNSSHTPQSSADLLLINGRTLINQSVANEIRALDVNRGLAANGQILAFRFKGMLPEGLIENGILLTGRIPDKVHFNESKGMVIRYPWDLIDANGSEIRQDISEMDLNDKETGIIDHGVFCLNKDHIYVRPGARVMPGTVLNAEHGPIFIDSGSTVMPNAVLEGPLSIGRNSLVKIGAKLYENTTIGPVCKVGGEVEESILLGYSNKQHDGFLGHSYLGAWINIGADTNNSDLKNNYGEITVYLNNKSIPTGRRFMGLIMGDHSKTAINTMFNTGTVVGVSCNIYGDGFPPKYIPSFSWGGSGGLREYNFDKSVEVARIVMERRKVQFTDRDLEHFKAVRELAEKTENRARVS